MKYKAHADRVAQLPCATCGAHGVVLHHPRIGQGMGQRAHDMLVIPLCPDCHTGPAGVHGDKSMMNLTKQTELQILGDTLARLYA
jgi:hypothetical protein